MAFYTDDELAALLSGGESQAVERKSQVVKSKRNGDEPLRKNVCAFANDLPGTGRPGVINPLVAEVMRHLGFAQRFGLGVPLARRELAENGNPEPEFDFQPAHVVVTVRAAG